MINFAYESLFKKDSVYKNMYIQIRETGNILRYPYVNSTVQTENVTIESRADGSVYFHGTRTSQVTLRFSLETGTITADMVGKRYNFIDTSKFQIRFSRGGYYYTSGVVIREEWIGNSYEIYARYMGEELSIDDVCYPYAWIGANNVLRNDEIYEEELELHESLCSSENIEFGSCESNYITFTTSRVNESFKGKTIVVWTQLDNKNDGYLCYGLFKVAEDNLTADRSKREITAYDPLYEILSTDVSGWYNTLFPDTETTHTLREVRDSFFGQFGELQIETTLPNDFVTLYKTTDTNSLSGYDVLFALCQINGCFGHFGRDGFFHYVFLDTEKGLFPSQTLFPSAKIFPRRAGHGIPSEEIGENGTYISCKYEDYYVHQIDKLVIRESSEDIGVVYGTGKNAYLIEDNFLLYGNEEIEDIAERLYEKISGLWYTPCEIEAQGNPCIEVGDNIHVLFKNEKKVATVLLHRTLKGVQALRDEYISDGTEYRGTQLNVFNKQVLKIQGKTNTLERTVNHTVSELQDLSESTDSRFEQTATSISAKISKTSPTGQTSFSWESTDTKMEWKTNGNRIMKLDSTGAEIEGKVTAKSGYIGNGSSGFEIGNTSIKNGMTSLSDTTHDGVYVGTDGIALGKGKVKLTNTGNGKIGAWDFGDNGFTYSDSQGASCILKPSAAGGLGGIAMTSQSINIGATRQLVLEGDTDVNINSDNAVTITAGTGNTQASATIDYHNDGGTKAFRMYTPQEMELYGIGGVNIHADNLLRVSSGAALSLSATGIVQILPSNTAVLDISTTEVYSFKNMKAPAFIQTSDRREKDDIEALDQDKAADFIYKLKPCEFVLIKDETHTKHHGFIAQEVKEEMYDEWGLHNVHSDEQKTEMLAYSELIADMVCTLQKQNKQIQLLQREIELLKGEQNDLR